MIAIDKLLAEMMRQLLLLFQGSHATETLKLDPFIIKGLDKDRKSEKTLYFE